MKVLVTGGSGFIGQALLRKLTENNIDNIRASVQQPPLNPISRIRYFITSDIDGYTCWREALEGTECIIHTIGRSHILKEISANPESEFKRINVDGTLNLAQQAAEMGCRRFIFLSSIKVNGEETILGCPYRIQDIPTPGDLYGSSKLEAEIGLREIESKTGMEVVIIRPPLVYGPGVKGNFLTLIALITRGIPLPFKEVKNLRSFVALPNLVMLIITCMKNAHAAGETFLVSDELDLSTPDMIRLLGRAAGRNPMLISAPFWLLRGGAALLGQKHLIRRLCSSLQVDISYTKQTLGWQPVYKTEKVLQDTVNSFLRMKEHR